MRLTLYHNNRDPVIIMNVIKISIGDERTLSVQIKERRLIEYRSYRFECDYQRLTIQID